MQAITQLRRWLTGEREGVGFKRSGVGWALSVLNLLAALNSTFFFLVMMRSGVVDWLMMNTCAPSSALFMAGFLLGSPVVMVAGSVLMFRYGTLGLFAFGWDGYNIIAQVGHVLMTLAVIYVVVAVVRGRRWRELVLGIALGLAILVPLMTVQTQWCNAHPEALEMLFSGEWELPGQ